jgi:hypothetical protein
MPSTEIAGGLHAELGGIREMLGVDRICWYQQSLDGGHFMRLCRQRVPRRTFRGASLSARSSIRGLHIQSSRVFRCSEELGRNADRGKDGPAEPASGREYGSLALVPSIGSAGTANAMMLTSFAKEIDWDAEVVAQLSVLASVFANAYTRKQAQEAGTESELRFQHLFQEAPIGCCLVDAGRPHSARRTLLLHACWATTKKN